MGNLTIKIQLDNVQAKQATDRRAKSVIHRQPSRDTISRSIDGNFRSQLIATDGIFADASFAPLNEELTENDTAASGALSIDLPDGSEWP